jgi:charged multivesicular body protein 1
MEKISDFIFGNPEKKMEEQLFNLKFTSKQMQKSADKCQKQEKAEKEKLKKALQQGNNDGAKIYAQNAIRQKNQYLNYLRLSARIDAVAARLDTALKMKTVIKNMEGVTHGMDAALNSMDPEKISKVMDKFEEQFEQMDVHSEYVENAMNNTTAMSTPQDEVDTLMQQVADEAGLELKLNMGSASNKVPTGAAGVKEDDALAKRLEELRKA